MKKILLPLIFILLLNFILIGNCTTVKTFLTTDTWTCPSDVTSIKVECRGSGGGGGGVAVNTNKSSGGGAGGQYAVKATFAVTPDTTYTVTVGAGGTAGANTGGNGGNGGDVWFSSNDTNGVVAKGGAGGQSYENGKAGGNGSTSGGFGDTVYAGGDAGGGGDDNSGGGGGEGAGSTETGHSTTTATGGTGGDGGDGGAGGTNTAGVIGIVPGGGGGGAGTTSSTDRLGGAGGKGKIVLTYETEQIDMGNPPFSVSSGLGLAGYTLVDSKTASNGAGKITSVEMYTDTGGLAGCEIGIFYVVSGNNLTCRSYVALGTVAAGYTQHDVDLDVEIGDYIGIRYTSGDISYNTATPGNWYINSDQIPCTNVTFSAGTSWFMSLCGTGSTGEAPPEEEGNAIMLGTNF